MRYKSYCSNMVRTLMVNPPVQMEKNYEFLCKLEDILLDNLKEGKKLSEVYDKVLAEATKERPELVKHLTKSFG